MQGPTIPEGPAWLVGIAIAGWVLVSIVRAVTAHRKNGQGSELATIVAMATEARRDFQAHTSALNAIVSNLAAMNERLNHLPTKEDLGKGLQQNRHDVRNAIQGLVKGDT